MLLAGNSFSQTVVNEAQLKSAYIISILNYVQWPNKDPSKIRNICIYSKNPFDDFLENFAKLSKSENKHPTVISYPSKISEVNDCDVIYFSRSSESELPNFLEVAKDKSILTISDVEGFCAEGGMVEFVSKKNRIKLHINYHSTKDAELEMSSLLLELAKIVINKELSKSGDGHD